MARTRIGPLGLMLLALVKASDYQILRDSTRLATARYHEQLQDHFDLTNKNRWQQAYYVNDTFWKPGSSAPIFLCVGGEGPALDASAVQSSVHCSIAVEWLPTTQALMFALEHRYYGCHNMSACPVSDLTSADALSYLSSRQAIEDIASFVEGMNAKYQLTSRNLWVTWGGSYPGMLAGWSRLKHPELIHASVASSAPVHATFDMPQYCDHMAYAYTISHVSVGGSEECRNAIRAGHAWVEERFQNGSDAEVATKFGLPATSLASVDQRVDFASMGVANFPAQENDPLCEEPACNIAKVCAIMTNGTLGDEVERLLKLRQAQGVQGAPLRGRARAMLREGRLRSPWRHSLTGVITQGAVQLPDLWFYQTCKEFGFYQTCEDTDCMFVRGLANASYMASECMKLFNITLEDVQSNIDATNFHYGGLLPLDQKLQLGRCVMFPNGEVDPWSTCSILHAPSNDLPTLYVQGASHHAWTWPSRAADQESVVSARVAIRRQVDSFLRMDCSEVEKSPGKSPAWLVPVAIAIGAVLLVVLVAWKCVRRRRREPLLRPSTLSLQPTA